MLRGLGVKNVVDKLFSEGSITVSNIILGHAKILGTFRYKHMGSICDWRYSDIPEAKDRAKETESATRYMNSFLRNRCANSLARQSLVFSLALSRLRVNVSSQCVWSLSATRIFDAVYHFAYCVVYLSRNADGSLEHITNTQLRLRCLIPSPAAYRSRIRLVYFMRFLNHAPDDLKSLVWKGHNVQGKDSWYSLILDDLIWLQDCCFGLT